MGMLWSIARLVQSGFIGSVIALYLFVLLAPGFIFNNNVSQVWSAAFYLFCMMGILASLVMIRGPEAQRGWLGLVWTIVLLVIAPYLCHSLESIHQSFSSFIR